jgi:hypothetical protein
MMPDNHFEEELAALSKAAPETTVPATSSGNNKVSDFFGAPKPAPA